MTRNLLLLPFALLSVLSTVVAEPTAKDRIAFGFANIQTVEVSQTGPHMKGGVIVALTDNTARVRSFGLSNEAGIAIMPLPPARYCMQRSLMAGSR